MKSVVLALMLLFGVSEASAGGLGLFGVGPRIQLQVGNGGRNRAFQQGFQAGVKAQQFQNFQNFNRFNNFSRFNSRGCN